MQLFGDKLHLNSRKSLEEQGHKADYESLIEGCKSGNRLSQKALYDALSRKMYAVCLRYMGEKEAAEDVLQDGFVTLFSKLESYSGSGSFEGWARKIRPQANRRYRCRIQHIRQRHHRNPKDGVQRALPPYSGAPARFQDSIQHVHHRGFLPQGDSQGPRGVGGYVTFAVAKGARNVAKQD